MTGKVQDNKIDVYQNTNCCIVMGIQVCALDPDLSLIRAREHFYMYMSNVHSFSPVTELLTFECAFRVQNPFDFGIGL